MQRDSPTRRRCVLLAAASTLAAQGALLGWIAEQNGPVYGELGCLPAGISHVQFERFDLYRVNPPLVRTVAALPVVLAGAKTDWTRYENYPLARPWQYMGLDFLKVNGQRCFWLFTLGRWACIPFCLLGGLICFLWARDLYGSAAGLTALTLWCFCPYALGYGSLITPDAHAAAVGLAAGYAFWGWLRRPSWDSAILAGLVLGLAELTKFTLLVLYPIWILVWLMGRFSSLVAKHGGPRTRRASPADGVCRLRCPATELTMLIAISILVINAGYCFERSCQRLDTFLFQSQALTGVAPLDLTVLGGNRFAGTLLGALRVPLPANYIQGIDTQKVDFERGFRSYLRGEWKHGGWWYYYLYALVIKLPLGTWVIFALAAAKSVWSWTQRGRHAPRNEQHLNLTGRDKCVGRPPSTPALLRKVSGCKSPSLPTPLQGTCAAGRGEASYNAPWRDELLLLIPAIAILLLVSSQTGFNIHSRYVLPALPFLFVWMSKAARSIQLRHWVVAGIAVGAICWSTASSLWYFPHSLSYFNELVGGPAHGHEHLLDSNIAWGQDLILLKDWSNRHPEAVPLHLASFGWVDPRLAGVESTLPPLGPDSEFATVTGDEAALGPLPGWYAIDVNHLHSTGDAVVDERGDLQRPTTQEFNWHYFNRFRPVAMAGYSIYIYHITADEANRVRREMGLPELSRSEPSPPAPLPEGEGTNVKGGRNERNE